MRIHATLAGSSVNGPGIRSVAFVQGCSLACLGCQNPKTHRFDAGEEITPEELAERIVREAAPGTEGVTISGGEPMQQALSVYRFITMIHALRPDWSLGAFSGYTLSELRHGEFRYDNDALAQQCGGFWDSWKRAALWEHQIQPHLDFAILGRYDRTKPPETASVLRSDRHAIASANQFIELFWRGGKCRYTHSDFPALGLEVQIEEGGLCQITGYSL